MAPVVEHLDHYISLWWLVPPTAVFRRSAGHIKTSSRQTTMETRHEITAGGFRSFIHSSCSRHHTGFISFAIYKFPHFSPRIINRTTTTNKTRPQYGPHHSLPLSLVRSTAVRLLEIRGSGYVHPVVGRRPL
jgi:hypothetical protein